MYRMNRCCERPMNYSSEASFKYSDTTAKMNEYPQAVPDASMANAMPSQMGCQMGCQMPPIYECPQERVCHREFVHEVPQD